MTIQENRNITTTPSSSTNISNVSSSHDTGNNAVVNLAIAIGGTRAASTAGSGPGQMEANEIEEVDNNNHYRGDKPLQNGCEDKWSWSKRDRSKEVWLSGAYNRTVHFHPNWSKGTAGIRGTRVLNNGRYYWELSVSQRVFGTR